MEYCNECPCIVWEDWPPHPTIAARCMNEYRPQSGIIPKGRALSVFPKGNKGPVHRPAWCPYNGERRQK